MSNGILPSQYIKALIERGAIRTHTLTGDGAVQPASLDLSLGRRAYRLRASFLPGDTRTVEASLNDVKMHEIDLSEGAVLETGCVYLVPLNESLNLDSNIIALANPKSSTGRLDVFTRVICDYASAFDKIPKDYEGPLYVEIAPRTFSILVRPGDRLVQLRFRAGDANYEAEQTVSIDLDGVSDNKIIGWRGRRHAGLVDISNIGGHASLDYWEPLRAPKGQLILDPNEFYILMSKEAIEIPPGQAAEMAPIATEIGEFRAHYAGFFDPGFGCESQGGKGSRAVLEVRGRDVPFMLRHGQHVAKLVFETMLEPPKELYGTSGSNYQAQGLRLSKHFK